MGNKYSNRFAFIIIYTAAYYSWLTIFHNQSNLLIVGSGLFTLTGALVSTFWLALKVRKNQSNIQPVWMLFFMGSIAFLLGDLSWFIIDAYFENLNLYPGLPDVFYSFQIILYLSAVLVYIKLAKKNIELYKYLFDSLMFITIVSLISYRFLVEPLIISGDLSLLELAFSIFYILLDVLLLFGLILLYYVNRHISNHIQWIYMTIGALILIFADTLYLYSVIYQSYFTGHLMDPLFVLPLLLIGYAASIKSKKKSNAELHLITQKESYTPLHLLPYLNVILLFMLMLSERSYSSFISYGFLAVFSLMLFRQLLVIQNNKHLINQLRSQSIALEISEKKHKSLFDNHPDAVFSMDIEGEFTSLNKNAISLLEAADLLGKKVNGFTLLEDVDRKRIMRDHPHFLRGHTRSYQIDVSLTNNKHYFHLLLIPMMLDYQLIGMYGIAKDITKEREAEANVRHLAYHDPLTGLANRLQFNQAIKQLIDRPKEDQSRFALFYIDLDDFKSVNDSYGHHIGDQLLKEVAKRLTSTFKGTSHLITRNGGDEFTILLYDCNDDDKMTKLADQLIHRLSVIYVVEGTPIKRTPSMGLAVYPDDAKTQVELLKKADQAMYQVKTGGKGKYSRATS